MLTADAFGVLPPIAKLSREQAMYHFLSGYTAKVAGTERGVSEPQATFSTCFGAPFMVHHPTVYARLLGRKIDEHDVGVLAREYRLDRRSVRRRPPHVDRAHARDGQCRDRRPNSQRLRNRAVLRLEDSQERCRTCRADVLNPRNAWADKAAYDEQARKLAQLFFDNFKRFEGHVSDVGQRGRDSAAC